MSDREAVEDEATGLPERDEEGRPLFDDAGVDLTLIRWMLSLTPRERLEVLERNATAARRLADAARASRARGRRDSRASGE